MSIKEKIYEWISFIQIPQTNLDNFPICPYAKMAIINDKIQILSLENLEDVSKIIEAIDIEKYWVTILYFNEYQNFEEKELSDLTKELNQKFNKYDKIILENDPRNPFYINEVKTTFDHCFLFLIQSLSDLNQKSDLLKNTSYYKFWTKEGLNEVVNWRKTN